MSTDEDITIRVSPRWNHRSNQEAFEAAARFLLAHGISEVEAGFLLQTVYEAAYSEREIEAIETSSWTAEPE